MSVNKGKHLVALLVLVLATTAARGSAQTFSPYSDFQAMSVTDLATLQVKLTYVGEFGNASLSSLLFGASADVLNPALFAPFRRPEKTYINDDAGLRRFTAAAQELKALIDSVATLPGVTDGDVDPEGYVSFSLLNTAGGTTRAFEAIVDSANGRALFDQMLKALKHNTTGVRELRSFGCNVAMLPTTAPTDVQAEVQLRASGLRADRRAAGEYVGKVRVTNTSKAAIQAPLLLVAFIRADADLMGADGETCNIRPQGHPFIYLLAKAQLLPGATVERTLRFANPSATKLDVEFKAFAGAGTP